MSTLVLPEMVDHALRNWTSGKRIEAENQTDWVFKCGFGKPIIGLGSRGLGPIGHDVAEAARRDTLMAYLQRTSNRSSSSLDGVSGSRSSPRKDPSRETLRELHEKRINVHTCQTIHSVAEIRKQDREVLKCWREAQKREQVARTKFVLLEKQRAVQSHQRQKSEFAKVNQWVIEENIAGKSAQKMLRMSLSENKHDSVQAVRRCVQENKGHMIASVMQDIERQHEQILMDKKHTAKLLEKLRSRQIEALKEAGDAAHQQREMHQRKLRVLNERRQELLTRVRAQQKALLPPRAKSTTVREMLHGV